MTSIEPKVNLQGRYTTNETCELLGICRQTLYRNVVKGKIKAGMRKANNRPFFRGSDILAFWRLEY